MGGKSESGWYKRIGYDKVGVNEVCYAKTADLAREYFGYPSVDIDVTRLTWMDMSLLTGCSLESIDDTGDYADNYLVFFRDGTTTILWVL